MKLGAIRWQRPVLIAVFAFQSIVFVFGPLVGGLPFGWDAVVYTHAAAALVSGGDPWLAHGYAIAFAAPPPSLLAFLPFTWLPDPVISWLWVAIATGSAIYSIRRLRMPLWWLLFPPIVLGIISGSGALLALALLVRGGIIGDSLAVATRVYSILPLAILGRWRSVVAALALLALSAPFLAWPAFIADRDRVAATFQSGAANLSATAFPWLIPIALICLILLGRRRAAWLIVPVLWPLTQPYYAVIALPVLADLPLTALSLAVPVPGLVVLGMAADLISGLLSSVHRQAPVSGDIDAH